jgi:DNA mismatch repair protein MutS
MYLAKERNKEVEVAKKVKKKSAAKSKPKETPLMKQYNSIKAKYPDALLLFRVGDFYETFGSDAVKVADVLGIVLTKRKNGAAAFIDLAGFPHHSIDTYLPKLVRAGYRVAICDQLEDPKATKSIVKRGVTELVTPGVAINDQVLEQRKNNFLAAVHYAKDGIGLALVDISTGEFLVSQGSRDYIDKLIQGLSPSEILYSKDAKAEYDEQFADEFHTYALDEWVFSGDFGREIMLRHFKTKTLKGYGVDDMELSITAAGAVLHYLGETRNDRLQHVDSISRIGTDDFVWLDKFTIRNLELFQTNHAGGRALIDVLDQTVSPMGGRLMRRWMVLPLKEKEAIEARHDVVGFFIEDQERASEISLTIKQIGDLERLISKVAVQRINPREVVQLKRALTLIPALKMHIKDDLDELNKLHDQLNECPKILNRINTELEDEAPVLLHKGGVIKSGVDKELDELRSIAFSGKDHLLEMQKRESERTGIASLKVSYNNVFGYYLEVRNTYKDKVPEEWIRKQTLTQAERYITPELKEYEEKILTAEGKIGAIEERIYAELVKSLAEYIVPIKHNAGIIARLDCLLSFTKLAIRNAYVRPDLSEGDVLDIKEGRHPVIEMNLPVGESYVANDVLLDPLEQQIMIITGPNMSGKSALLRQTALIVLMAQMGAYVPAKKADIGLVDKIFTRVGASDNISSGESTFMVEMNETASILNNISAKSLILLDEIGRGTSTYDGISIAWAISEFIHEHPKSRAKTLFATHYHELNQMTDEFARIKNFNVSVKEVENRIIFLRKLKQGGSNHSFGIHVARMAGMPQQVVLRANEVLGFLEKNHRRSESTETVPVMESDDMQLSFFKLDDPVLENIREQILHLDINTLTPVEALMKLNEIKKLIGG